MELFRVGKTIIKKLNENGFEAFFVGGCVRDYYMDREVHDVDITTDAMPDEVKKVFSKTIDVGMEHGTIIVMADDIPFEVTTYRSESGDSDHRHAGHILFNNRLNEDLKRRDFTMNAMAMSKEMTFHDPFKGSASIDKQEIITVGEPGERFGEDALRIIRAIRFMSILNFSIETSTENSMIQNAHTIENVSVERIVLEIKKTYSGTALKKAKEKLVETRVIEYIPFFKYINQEDYLHSNADDFMDELIIQSIKGDSLIDRIDDLKISNLEKALVKNSMALQQAVMKESPRRIAYQYHEDVIRRLIRLNRDNELIEDVAILNEALTMQPSLIIRSKKDLEINGSHLMGLYGMKSGPWIKECLNIIENEVLFERVNNNHNDIINWVKRHVEIGPESIKVIK